MQIASYRATERGIRNRMAEQLAEERNQRLKDQRAQYERRLEEAQHIAEIKLASALRADAMAKAMRDKGYRYQHTYREIERRACQLFGVTPKEVRSARRSKEIAFVRSFIAYWCCRLTELSLPQIGRLMNRDHTSVLAAKRRYTERRWKMGRNLPETT